MKDNEPVVNKDRRLMILQEVDNWKRKATEDDTWHDELNNFHGYLPSDDYIGDGGSYYSHMATVAGLIDRVNDVSFPKDRESRRHHSQLFYSQTPRQFFETINKVIGSLPEVSLEKIKKLQHEHLIVAETIRLHQNMDPEEEKREQEKIDLSMKYLKELYEHTLPLYMELRVMGYSHFDLTA